MNLKLKRAKELAQFFAKTVREEGLSPTMHRTAGYLRRRLKSKKGRFWPSKELCAAQRAADTSSWPRISFCVPLSLIHIYARHSAASPSSVTLRSSLVSIPRSVS